MSRDGRSAKRNCRCQGVANTEDRMRRNIAGCFFCSLLQFCVFGLGFVEEGDVGVGVFPRGEEVLIGDASLGSVALLLKQAAQLQLSDDEQYVGAVAGFQIHDLLKILLRLGVTPSLLVGNATGVKNAGSGASIEGSGVNEVDGLCRVGLGGICGALGSDRAAPWD